LSDELCESTGETCYSEGFYVYTEGYDSDCIMAIYDWCCDGNRLSCLDFDYDDPVRFLDEDCIWKKVPTPNDIQMEEDYLGVSV